MSGPMRASTASSTAAFSHTSRNFQESTSDAAPPTGMCSPESNACRGGFAASRRAAAETGATSAGSIVNSRKPFTLRLYILDRYIVDHVVPGLTNQSAVITIIDAGNAGLPFAHTHKVRAMSMPFRQSKLAALRAAASEISALTLTALLCLVASV